MPEYKLYYFPLLARAEPVRLLLSHAKADWEDVTIPSSEWPKHKPSMPEGQLPVLELKDGTKIGQSNTILRLVGRELGYYPVNDTLLAAKIDSLIDSLDDTNNDFDAPYLSKSKDDDEEVKKLFSEVFPKFLSNAEKYLDDGHKFLVSDNLTIADFIIGGFYVNVVTNKKFAYAQSQYAELATRFPKFGAYGERFTSELRDVLAKREVYHI